MNQESELSISKPAPFWTKPPQLDLKQLFKSLSKVAISAALGKWDDALKDAIDFVDGMGLGDMPGETAWKLVYRSLVQAMLSLVKKNEKLLFKKPKQSYLEQLYESLGKFLESSDLSINQDFFNNPKNTPFVAEMRTAFAGCLQYFGLNQDQAKIISDSLPTYFVSSLHKEWAKHPDKYACLKQEVDTPFTEANQREQSWLGYVEWLQKQVKEPIFFEDFGLETIYIPLRAYYKRRIKPQKNNYSFSQDQEQEKHDQVVVDLKNELEAWLNKAEPKDAIRVISGGPGSGKSSFAKIFAAEQAANPEIRVLFIPLHLFEVEDNLNDAVGQFFEDNNLLDHNPLENNHNERLLIIFDGLDELTMQGKFGVDAAQAFIQKLVTRVDNSNQKKTSLQILITGRELVVPANNNPSNNSEQQILHILPYFVNDNQRKNYNDENDLLKQDQRDVWWQKYGEAKNVIYTCLPTELNHGKIIEITAQPLLNYLVALSFARGTVQFCENSNLNIIYADLLEAVYERRWGDRERHPVVRELGFSDFAFILEEIALVCWHGDGQTTTVNKIQQKCDNNSYLKTIFNKYQQAAEAGVIRLLTAFYFRQNVVRGQDKTFEFTHKNFGEYLTARRIVNELQHIHHQLYEYNRRTLRRRGWDESESLEHWAIICGISPIDQYLFDFICDEIRLHSLADVENWQQNIVLPDKLYAKEWNADGEIAVTHFSGNKSAST